MKVTLEFESAADAVGQLLEVLSNIRAVECSTSCDASCATPAATPAAAPDALGAATGCPTSTEDMLYNMLHDTRYEFRTVTSLCSKSGLSRNELFALLDREDVPYRTRTRRSDGEALVGLAH